LHGARLSHGGVRFRLRLVLSSNARQLFSDKSSEYIPFDQPGFVVDAIRDVYRGREKR
jgi:hypothetical protein